jgi:hypothetical protein
VFAVSHCTHLSTSLTLDEYIHTATSTLTSGGPHTEEDAAP